MALLAKQIPKHYREIVRFVVETYAFGAGDQRLLGLTGGGDAGQVALDVGGEYRHARARKSFGQHLQGDGLTSAGRARDQAMSIGERQRQQLGLETLADENCALRVDVCHVGHPLRRDESLGDYIRRRGSSVNA